jgi:beta-phosphoglucomutase family hydrolase
MACSASIAGTIPRVIDLPPGIQTCLFDLDGVLTRTAAVHAQAWKEMFDAFLRERAEREGIPFVPFDAGSDYAKYVDGRPRLEGVSTFLDARGVVRDPAVDRDLADRKNVLVLGLIRERGVEVFEGSVRFLRAAEKAGYRRAVVSSSANAGEVLEVTGLAPLIEVLIDGKVAERDGLKGKPAPDTFLAGAKALGTPPRHAAVFEDALAGVAAGKAGGFGLVVGVDRLDQADALREHGATVVVRDLDELLRTP